MWRTFTLLAGYIWPAIVSWWFVLLVAYGVQSLVLALRPYALPVEHDPFLGLLKFALATACFGWAACALAAIAFHIGARVARRLRT